jgi:hypothetical protein
MASVRREILIFARPEEVWAGLRDFGGAQRLCPDLLVDCRLEEDARVVTFVDGRVARELLVDIDDEFRRVVYAEPAGKFITRNGALQVFTVGENCSRVVWINDLLPNDLATLIDSNMEKGLASMKATLERSSGGLNNA